MIGPPMNGADLSVSSRAAVAPASKSARGYLPIAPWLFRYRRANLPGDLIAGLVVALMAIPQNLAYAQLAGLPPQVGLYASIVPVVLYALLASSRTVSIGPVAIVSLLVAQSLGALAPRGGAEYVALALALALLVGIVQLVLGIARLGFLVNFLSHPVIAGFTGGAALVIAFGQVTHLMGVKVPHAPHPYQSAIGILERISDIRPVTFGLGVASILVLLLFEMVLGPKLLQRGFSPRVALPIARCGPLVVVALGTLMVWALRLDTGAGVEIVGAMPAGLPPIAVPTLDLGQLGRLLPTAFIITVVGFTEGFSTATVLAGKRRERVDANRELIAQGVANVGAAFSGGYPVAGALSRSSVNFGSGATTQLSSLVTAGLFALTVIALTPLFFFMPAVAAAAIVLVAVARLIDFPAWRRVWEHSRADGIALFATFFAVLIFDPEIGIVIGVFVAIALYLWRTSHPRLTVVGRVGESDQFLDADRHEVRTYVEVLVLRVDGDLYFANAKRVEEELLRAVATLSELHQVVLIFSGVNYVDASALETLGTLVATLRDSGVDVSLAEVKDDVQDILDRGHFTERLGRDRIFSTTGDAMRALGRG
jgi:SulP family sulfate permease